MEPSPLERVETYFVNRIPEIDPFEHPGRLFPSVINAVLATALFRCWHLILFFSAWATCVTVLSEHGTDLSIQSTLLTVLGTVLGFVISYRTSSSFERYNEGRKYWSSIVYATRTFARTAWFHVPDVWAPATSAESTKEEQRGRTIIEKKSALNLVAAFSIALKHYLRGEEGIYYEDLYPLVKYLPSYSLPAGLPPNISLRTLESPLNSPGLPVPGQSPYINSSHDSRLPGQSPVSARFPHGKLRNPTLMPARDPPKGHLFDIFPFSLLVHALTKKGKSVKGKKGARERAKRRIHNHNIPLEITLYLSSYIASLQFRKHCDVPTINGLTGALNTLVDSLTGLERILTTPIPFSYSVHLWTVTLIYVFFLPCQIYKTLGWITIPSTAIVSFMFFGFLVAGEEIENPFGYDKNDLNLDHFTQNIIIQELNALATRPVPDVSVWAFKPENDVVFGQGTRDDGVTPEEWVRRGVRDMRMVMERGGWKSGSG